MPYERPNIQALHAYTPGDQPKRRDLIKLNTNENPYPPAPAVLEAIAATPADSLRRYPPPAAQTFRETAARVHGLDPSQVIATNGGDELLRLMLTVFCSPRAGETSGGLGVAEPGYSLYPVLADIHDTPVTYVPLAEDWSLPSDFAARIIEAGCGLAIIINPHAPSGRLATVDQLDTIARELMGKTILMIDEAYVDFAEHDALPLLDPSRGLDNVLLLRTLSKGYSLAGLRFGYGLGHAGVIAALDKARDSYNTDILAQRAAVAALEARDVAATSWQNVIAERTRVTAALTELGCAIPPSASNFVLASPNPDNQQNRPNAASIYESLKESGIYVRYFDQDRLRDKLRITIGTPAENDALLTALAALLR